MPRKPQTIADPGNPNFLLTRGKRRVEIVFFQNPRDPRLQIASAKLPSIGEIYAYGATHEEAATRLGNVAAFHYETDLELRNGHRPAPGSLA